MGILVQMDLPESIFSLLHKDKDEIVKMFKLCTAVKLYEMRKISQEKASELAGMSRGEFLLSLKDFEITPYQYSSEDIVNEVKNLGF